MVFFRAQRGR